MILAIDAGNTNTVFAVYSGARLVNEWRISTHRSRTADEYIVWLSSVMSMEKVVGDEIKGAIISTVVPQMLFDLQQLCRRWFRVEPLVVGDPAVDLGIDIKVANPRDVGADRLVNAVAAHSAYKGPLMVLDFGTATTFDIVDADGAYRGGVIAPGINLSLEALHQAAAKLPRIAIRRPEHIIGTDTVSAMQSGVYWGYVGLIEGLVKRIRAEMGGEATVIATGGLARLFDAATEVIQHVETDLTMRGLVEIYHRNTV